MVRKMFTFNWYFGKLRLRKYPFNVKFKTDTLLRVLYIFSTSKFYLLRKAKVLAFLYEYFSNGKIFISLLHTNQLWHLFRSFHNYAKIFLNDFFLKYTSWHILMKIFREHKILNLYDIL